MLFEKAEELSRLLGGETLFSYVHPNNHEMLAFLKHQGYTVLDLIEVRKPSKDEQLSELFIWTMNFLIIEGEMIEKIFLQLAYGSAQSEIKRACSDLG